MLEREGLDGEPAKTNGSDARLLTSAYTLLPVADSHRKVETETDDKATQDDSQVRRIPKELRDAARLLPLLFRRLFGAGRLLPLLFRWRSDRRRRLLDAGWLFALLRRRLLRLRHEEVGEQNATEGDECAHTDCLGEAETGCQELADQHGESETPERHSGSDDAHCERAALREVL